MTCIIGYEADGGVYLIGDRRVSYSGWCDTAAFPKIGTATLRDQMPIGFGCAGNPRILQLLQYAVEWRMQSGPGDEEPFGWLVRKIIPLVKGVVDEAGVPGCDREAGTLDASLIFAVAGQVLRVERHWQVFRSVHRFLGIGLCDQAEGVLYALEQVPNDLPPSDRLRLAIEACAQFAQGVGPPYDSAFVAAKADQ